MAPPYPMHPARSAAHIDLNSREAEDIPAVRFIRPEQHRVPVTLFSCLNAVGTCMLAKEWHLLNFGNRETPHILRIDSQALDHIENDKEGTLVMLEEAAGIDRKCGGRSTYDSVGIMTLLMPKDSRVRFFYSTVPYASLLRKLEEEDCIEFKTNLNPVLPNHIFNQRRDPHCRVFNFIQESFFKALHLPHAPDYLNAMSLTNYAPDIRHPETALRRIEQLAWEHFPRESKDISTDRYLLHLHPAERELASVADLHCAEYMLVKRVFFKEFYDEVMRTEKKIGQVTGRGRHAKPVRVRSETAHVGWLESVYHWGRTRAKRLILGWETLGLLDERRLLPWIKAGGMLAESELEDYEEDGMAGETGNETGNLSSKRESEDS